MTNIELAAKVTDIAENKKTIYVMGCFGAPMKTAYIDRYLKAYSYNKGREKMIRAVENKGYFAIYIIIKKLKIKNGKWKIVVSPGRVKF